MMLDDRLAVIPNVVGFNKLMEGQWLEHATLGPVGKQIIKRHGYKCCICGLVSKPSKQVQHGYMVPFDPRHEAGFALDAKAGYCLCALCAATKGLNWAVMGRRIGNKELPPPGVLMVQHVLPQSDITRLASYAIAVLASRKAGSSNKVESAARDIDAAMLGLNENIFGVLPFYRGSDSGFARALNMLDEEFYEQRDEIMGCLKWWPSMSYWREQGIYWMQSTYSADVKALHAEVASHEC